MKMDVLLPILGDVLRSPVVIGTTIAVILYLNFVFFVACYKKKPPKPKKHRVVAAAPAPAKSAESEDGGDDVAEAAG